MASRQGSGVWQSLPNVANRAERSRRIWGRSPGAAAASKPPISSSRKARLYPLGHSDRIIKIEDKTCQLLVQIEHEFRSAHEWVADAVCGLTRSTNGWRHRLRSIADGINALREQGRAAVMAVLKKHTAATQDTIALPRYWRFADELPRNTQAKIVAADFQTAFSGSANCAREWPLKWKIR